MLRQSLLPTEGVTSLVGNRSLPKGHLFISANERRGKGPKLEGQTDAKSQGGRNSGRSSRPIPMKQSRGSRKEAHDVLT